MPKRRGLHLIPGGKSGDTGAHSEASLSESCEKLLLKARHYGHLATDRCDSEICSLVSDMIDAIKALDLLEQSNEEEGRRRAIEYRRLIAELEIEIVAALGE